MLIFRIAIKTIKRKQNEINNRIKIDDGKSSLFEQFLNCPDVDLKDVLGVCVDLILGGVDTVSIGYIYSLFLYNIIF